MTKQRNEKTKEANSEYIKHVLKSLDDDLAVLAVIAAVSLNQEHFIKILIAVSDVTYFRNMQRDIENHDASSKKELSPDEIKELLKSDGWLL